MIKTKQKVAISNNFIIINNKQFIFHENHLIILKDDNNILDISLLKIYSPYVQDTKMTKFHFSNNYVIFFFLYRKNMQGVNFYVIISLQELFLLIW